MRGMKAPEQLAKEMFQSLGDADFLTANAAIDMVRILVRHRKEAENEFTQRCREEAKERKNEEYDRITNRILGLPES